MAILEKHDAKYKVSFLFDHKNNWIIKYFSQKEFADTFKKYQFNFSINYKEIKNNDIVFILGYTNILGSNFLKSNKLNLVVHESDLPKGKGFAPVQWQILEGKNIIHILLLEAGEKVDSGDIILKDEFHLEGNELYEEIRNKQALATKKLISKFLNLFPNYSKYPQKGSEAFYKKRSLKDGEINIDKSIRSQFNLLRIGNNEEWPSFFYINNSKYILKLYKE